MGFFSMLRRKSNHSSSKQPVVQPAPVPTDSEDEGLPAIASPSKQNDSLPAIETAVRVSPGPSPRDRRTSHTHLPPAPSHSSIRNSTESHNSVTTGSRNSISIASSSPSTTSPSSPPPLPPGSVIEPSPDSSPNISVEAASPPVSSLISATSGPAPALKAGKRRKTFNARPLALDMSMPPPGDKPGPDQTGAGASSEKLTGGGTGGEAGGGGGDGAEGGRDLGDGGGGGGGGEKSPEGEAKKKSPALNRISTTDGWSASGHFKAGNYVLDSQKFTRIDPDMAPEKVEEMLKAMADKKKLASVLSSDSTGKAESSNNQLPTGKDLEDVKILGSGASGSVSLMRHRVTGELYAVKSIRGVENINIGAEISAADSIQHPNLVRTINSFATKGAVCIVQEFMDRGTLNDITKAAKTVPENVLCNIARQVVLGLQHLHSDVDDAPTAKQPERNMSLDPKTKRLPKGKQSKHKLVHRDLKPENILINSRGEVKIADFGIMALSSSGGRSTFVGTSGYMSPERIQGMHYTEKSDIWAYGVSVVELATGTSPFQRKATGFIELLMAITSGEGLELPDSMPIQLKEHVELCLKQNPSERLGATQLLETDWLKNCSTTNADVANWLETIS
eukprot:NODE_135_length_2245_cov_95.621585_g110_i0.p1 GENE.NODE_135_length_2245_cov_95.621585_g110_i0~~NODE_135_length_2245_cov_95.621585_g110_i0.p1  ORF type:complete len:620 (-),score=169.20 NODE_135_length_2245_cov_95.621585_g110_i0:274-2133(-)